MDTSPSSADSSGETRNRTRRAKRVARRLGVTLLPGHHGLAVAGHHGFGIYMNGQPPTGCGTYDLVLDVDAGEVVCANCGARPLTPTQP